MSKIMHENLITKINSFWISSQLYALIHVRGNKIKI